jgi:tetrahydromethanopterin S-methyltransferase subunit F
MACTPKDYEDPNSRLRCIVIGLLVAAVLVLLAALMAH